MSVFEEDRIVRLEWVSFINKDRPQVSFDISYPNLDINELIVTIDAREIGSATPDLVVQEAFGQLAKALGDMSEELDRRLAGSSL